MRALTATALAGALTLTACFQETTAPTSSTSSQGTIVSSSATQSGGLTPVTAQNAVRLAYLYNLNKTELGAIDWNRFTHVALFNVAPVDDGSIYRYASYNNTPIPTIWDGSSFFKDTIVPILRASGRKVLLVVGGAFAPSDSLGVICLDPVRRANFVNQLAELVNGTRITASGQVVPDAPFDGLDVDWEFPRNAYQEACMTQMLGEMRAKMPGKLLTAAVSYQPAYYDVPGLAANLDWVGLMTYDYGTSQNRWDHSPYGMSVNSAAQYNAAGLPYSKMLLGIAMYGRDKANANAEVTWKTALLDWPNKALLFSPLDSQTAKATWTINTGLKGVMYWEATQDNYSHAASITKLFDDYFKSKGR